MSAKSTLHQQQRDWATTAGHQPDSRGYLPSYEINLLQPLSAEAHRSFAQGSGSELLPSEGCPPKMAALHSSSALAVNAFDYWSDKPLGLIAAALALEQTPTHFRFEAQFPTGLRGKPPHLDLAFFFPDGHILGIESKFTEWFAAKPISPEPFKHKYFPEGVQLWTQAGLPGAQRLAESMQRGERSFRHLDAPQLLKHMLGLSVAAPGRFSLGYLYFECLGEIAAIHRGEIQEFTEAVGVDCRVYASSYQQLFSRLRTTLGQEHRLYLDYVTSRYCLGDV